MPPRGARTASAERRTLDAPLDADVRGGGRADVAHERQRVGRRLLELEDVAIGDFEVGDAGLGRPDDAGRPVCVRERVGEPRLPERLVGGGGREQGVAVGEQDELVALEVAQPALVVEVRDLRGDADAEIEVRDVGGHLQEVGIVLKEALDRRNGRPAFFHARPELGDRLADRRYDAHSGDDDASTCSHVSHPETASCTTLPLKCSGSRIACNGKGIGNRLDNCRATPVPLVRRRRCNHGRGLPARNPGHLQPDRRAVTSAGGRAGG